MPATRVFLTAVMTDRNGKRVWTGEYACSICDQSFRPDPTDPAELSREFSTHRYEQHAAATEEIS
jgi:hypothetical protein